jgi:hypothetical protein
MVADFALAVDRGDTPRMVGLLCREEARGVTDDGAESGDAERDTRSKPIPVTTSDVRIKGNLASVVVTRPAQKPRAVHLRKERALGSCALPLRSPVRSCPAGEPSRQADPDSSVVGRGPSGSLGCCGARGER